MTKPRRTLTSIVFGLTLWASAIVANAQEAARPNIVFILADDVGREVLGSYGGQSYATPNLDRLAREGARLEHCYSMPVCHPTRVTLLTGRYPRHLGNPQWGSFPRQTESQTFAHVLKRAGYATAIAGKWQVGLLKEDLDQPARLGFDEWALFGWHEGPRYYDPMIYQNGKLRADTKGAYGPELYVEFLIQFIESHRDRPFLAYYSMALCHDVTDDLDHPVPYNARGRYDSFREMAENMDDMVGRLMAALDRMNLREKTLVLFTTDNGSPKASIIRADGQSYVREPVVSMMNGRAIPGGKTDLTDWGTRVPTIANWKGVIEPGQVWDHLVDFSDILPTFAELSGGSVPAGVRLDGHSIAGLLTSGKAPARKWAYAETARRFFVKTRDWKLYSDGTFFHTANDPFETKPIPTGRIPAESAAAYELLSDALQQLQTSR